MSGHSRIHRARTCRVRCSYYDSSPPSHILLIISKLNAGFGGGNMLGANQARGKYILFLNSDVLLTEDCIKPLCDMLENNPHIG